MKSEKWKVKGGEERREKDSLLEFPWRALKMSILQAEPSHSLKQRSRFVLAMGCLTGLLISPFLLYYAYCWGWWGYNSLLLQHLFQCNCPIASEDARYPDEVDVIVSACRHDYSVLSPSGRMLYVRYKAISYLLDLQTMERTDVSRQPAATFLTDNLGFIEDGITDFIIDRTTGKQYPIRDFRYWREDTYLDGKPDVDLLASHLRQAEQVFLTPNHSRVIVLMPDFFIDPKQGFTFSLFDFPEWDHTRVEQFLQENNISYGTTLPWFPHEVLSPDGRLLAKDDGIYLVETDQMILKAPVSFVSGWTHDGRGVIYGASHRCLLRLGFPMGDDSWCEIEVPQPVLLLKVPEEYLLSTQTP